MTRSSDTQLKTTIRQSSSKRATAPRETAAPTGPQRRTWRHPLGRPTIPIWRFRVASRAVFGRCAPEFDVCVDERVLYRQMPLGSSWSAPERVSPTGLFEARGPHVAKADKIMVFYLAD